MSLFGEFGIKVYIAASWQDREIVHKVIQEFWKEELSAIRKYNFAVGISSYFIEVPHDWTTHEEPGRSVEYCDSDKFWVKNAEFVVLLNGRHRSAGKFWECGMADALDIPIIAIGEKVTTVFRHDIAIMDECSIYEKSAEDIANMIKENVRLYMAARAAGLKLRNRYEKDMIMVAEVNIDQLKELSPQEVSKLLVEQIQNAAKRYRQQFGDS